MASTLKALEQAEKTLLQALSAVRDATTTEQQLTKEVEALRRRCEEEAQSRQKAEQELVETKTQLQLQEQRNRQYHSTLSRTMTRFRGPRLSHTINRTGSPLHLRGGILPLPMSRAASFCLPDGQAFSASEAGDGVSNLPLPADLARRSADGIDSTATQFKRSYTMDISGLLSMLMTANVLHQGTLSSPNSDPITDAAPAEAVQPEREQSSSPFARKASNASSSRTTATKAALSASAFLSDEMEEEAAQGGTATHAMMSHPPSMSSVSLVDDDGTSGVGLAAAAAVAAAAARAWATAASQQQRHTRASRSHPNIWDRSSPTNGDAPDAGLTDPNLGHTHGHSVPGGANGHHTHHHPHRKSKAGYKLVASVYREPNPGSLRKSPSQAQAGLLQQHPSGSLAGGPAQPTRVSYPGQTPSRAHSLTAPVKLLDGGSKSGLPDGISYSSLPPGGDVSVRTSSPGPDSQGSFIGVTFASMGSVGLDAVGGMSAVASMESLQVEVGETSRQRTGSKGTGLPAVVSGLECSTDASEGGPGSDAAGLLTSEATLMAEMMGKKSLVSAVAEATAQVYSAGSAQVVGAVLTETESGQFHGSFTLEEPTTKPGQHLGITVPVDAAVGHSVPAKVAGVAWGGYNETNVALPSPLITSRATAVGPISLPNILEPPSNVAAATVGESGTVVSYPGPPPALLPSPVTSSLGSAIPSVPKPVITNPAVLETPQSNADKAVVGTAVGMPSAMPTPQMSDLVRECSTCDSSSKSSALTLHWLSPPQTVLVVCKLSPAVYSLLNSVIEWLRDHHLAVYVEPAAYQHVDPALRRDQTLDDTQQQCQDSGTLSQHWPSPDASREGAARQGQGSEAEWRVLTWAEGRCANNTIPDEVVQTLDFVVVLGGDGTLLWTCHVFGNRAVPPLLPFNMGSLGFLTPFPPAQIDHMLDLVTQGGFPMILRHRLHATIVRAPRDGAPATGDVVWADGHSATEKVVLNEVVVDRGISPFLTNLECFCDGNFVTHVQGDGLIISTPTGSTAYSLAAGGSMVHPQVPGILFTPVCPHSLSFRPLVFPDHVQLCIQVPNGARSQMYCSFDGKDRVELNAGDAVIIRMSQWPIPTVCSHDPSRDWFTGIREGLHWNTRLVQAGAGH